ncbi:MAG: asparagine synthase (glutamine-hydrolyzing) [Woeseia sp.]|nr:asparagine synthase (glutamine-hydrolyzing) [Woeseia sp.]NNE59361.1 asparagine synthase (glutamine-hydrolyzing) [Woeseia sp.]
MCGIAGILGKNYEKIEIMRDRLQHRGPDNSHHVTFHDERLSLAHTRLRIIDLHERSNQPFKSSCGNYILTFNGEIYNFKELKVELECSGQTFATDSDTEVLLYWLAKHGMDGINRLDGMFAFALYDVKNSKLLCARDHLGEKPFFYFAEKTAGELNFVFASEIKAMLGLVPKGSVNVEALSNYLRFLYVPSPQTLYDNIRELPPGHAMEISLRENSARVARYYDLAGLDFEKHRGLSYKDTVDAFYAAMTRTMETRMIADVPVALLLSGGLDSNALLGFIKKLGLGNKIHPYTAAYKGHKMVGGGDESHLALAAMEYQQIKGRVIEFESEFDLEGSIDLISNSFDQPYGNSTALVAWRLFNNVSKHCRVALVGDGGDEILSGYPRHKALTYKRYFNALPGPLTRLTLGAVNAFPEAGKFAIIKRRARGFLENSSMPLADSFLNWTAYLNSQQVAKFLPNADPETRFFLNMRDLFTDHKDDPLRAASLVDLSSWIPHNLLHGADTTSMSNSLEVRVPFLAKELVELTLSLNSRHKVSLKGNKPILADAAADLIPKEILRQPKRGFNPPIQAMMSQNIEKVKGTLRNKSAPIFSHVDYKAVNVELDAFLSQKKDNSTHLWGMLVLNRWFEKNNL